MPAPRVLVVEDENIVAKDIVQSLKNTGYAVAGMAASGEEAISKAEALKPDLVLMDIMLQGEMDGIEAARRITVELGLPVVYLTAYADADTLARAKVTTPFGYILKPFEDRELHTVIEIALYRHKVEEELRRAARLEALKTMAGGIAHEFNNLLTVILGSVSLARMYVRPEMDIFKLLTEAEGASFRAKELTRQLLMYTRGGEESAKSTISPKKLLRDLCVAVAGEDAACRCEVSVPKDIRLIRADRGQLTQALNNLLLCIGKNAPEGGRIDVTAENVTLEGGLSIALEPGDYIKLTVSNPGALVEKELIEHIFDPFSPTLYGKGLELATAYSTIKDHGGHISVDSEQGKGMTFTIYLPVAEAVTVETRPEAEEEAEAVPGGGGRILVMDDEETIRMILARSLHQLGYESEFVENGDEAVDLYGKASDDGKRFDAVIMDLVVPGGMGGVEAAREILKTAPNARLIISSGYSDDPVMTSPAQYGFVGALPKPYTIKNLGTTLRRVLGG